MLFVVSMFLLLQQASIHLSYSMTKDASALFVWWEENVFDITWSVQQSSHVSQIEFLLYLVIDKGNYLVMPIKENTFLPTDFRSVYSCFKYVQRNLVYRFGKWVINSHRWISVCWQLLKVLSIYFKLRWQIFYSPNLDFIYKQI
jgi:hypothetical protein